MNLNNGVSAFKHLQVGVCGDETIIVSDPAFQIKQELYLFNGTNDQIVTHPNTVSFTSSRTECPVNDVSVYTKQNGVFTKYTGNAVTLNSNKDVVINTSTKLDT